MARMYPEPIRPDTRSQAERTLYSELQRQLPNTFIVFHSIAWQIRDTVSGVQDGETDFAVVHPDQGILLLEVKGGRIRYDGRTEQWFSNQNPIKDPFKQGRQAKYSLLKKLQELPFWRSRWVTVGYAAVFPDVAVKGDLRLDAPRELILDAWDMTELPAWIDTAFQYLQGLRPDDGPLGAAGVGELIEMLSPSWDLRPLLSTEILEEQRELVHLTEEQFVMLDFLGRHRRAAISGCAGSGKTTLAMEKARRLAEHDFRVLLTCFNVNLAEFLRADEALPRNLDILNFHKLATDLCRRADVLPTGPRDDRFWDAVLPECMMDTVDRLGTQYDAIIVDEGQDFRGNWWIPLQCLLHDPDQGILYVFFDDNQNLYRATQSISLELAPFPLTRNCRNTQHIHKTVMQFYKSDQMPLAQGPLGRPVELHTYADARELKRTLSRVLHRLVAEESLPTEDIVILTPKGRERSALWHLGPVGNFQLTERWTTGGGEVFCSTIHSFKGLESPVVILTEIEPYAARDSDLLLYVGCSRACNHLIVIASTRLPKSLLQKITFA